MYRHVASFLDLRPERMRTSPNRKFSAISRGPLPFGQWSHVQPYWLGVPSSVSSRRPKGLGPRCSRTALDAPRRRRARAAGVEHRRTGVGLACARPAGRGARGRARARNLGLSTAVRVRVAFRAAVDNGSPRQSFQHGAYDLRVRLHRLRPCLGSGAIHQRGAAHGVPSLPSSQRQAPDLWRRRLHPQGWWLVRGSVQQRRLRKAAPESSAASESKPKYRDQDDHHRDDERPRCAPRLRPRLLPRERRVAEHGAATQHA